MQSKPQTPARMSDKTEELLRVVLKDVSIKDQWRPMLHDCYAYALPGRRGFYAESEGRKRTANVYDSTAVVSLQNFASQLQAGLTPNFARWAILQAGSDFDQKERQKINTELEPITEAIFAILENSNFSAEAHECYLDLGVGTMCMLVENGDAINPIKFCAVPLTEILLGIGPYGDVARITRQRQFKLSHIMTRWPNARMTKEMLKTAEEDPTKEIEIFEVTYRDYDANEETWHHCVLARAEKHEIWRTKFEGHGSNPWVVARWSKASGETYGRGPIVNALADIKTANKVVELTLMNAEMAMIGMFQAEDDGVLNPDTISLAPGIIIPIAQGSGGLKAIQPSGNFNVSTMVLRDMRERIERALYEQPLGSPDQSPKKAAEVQARMADLARKVGSAYGRLQYEFVHPLIARVTRILRDRGLVELPKVNGREVGVMATSPLARQQNYQDVEAITQTCQTIGTLFGPQMLNMVIKAEEAGKEIANKLGAPKGILRSEPEQAQLAKQIAGLAQAQTSAGGTPMDALNVGR